MFRRQRSDLGTMLRQRNHRLRLNSHPYLPRGRSSIHSRCQPFQHRPDEGRKQYIDVFEETIRVNKDDKTTARQLVDDILRRLMTEVRRQPGGEIYGVTVTKAGSYPVNTKIGKADEFDTNIPLNLPLKKVHRENLVYTFDSPYGLPFMIPGTPPTKTLHRSVRPVDIPPGYRVIEIDKTSVQQKFQHTTTRSNSPVTYIDERRRMPFLFTPSIIGARSMSPGRPVVRRQETLLNSGSVYGCIQVIPKDIKDDLMVQLRMAIKASKLQSIVSLQRKPHGPALTLVYKSGAVQSVQHNIDIDIVASVSYDINMSTFEWPRSETRRAFSADLIDNVLQAGTHLIPKHDLYWSVSFSRMERALLSGIDAGFGCRKYVLRILKRLLQKWKHQPLVSVLKSEEISSHILKTQLFWSCEKHCDDPGYWHRNNRDVCLINTMEELKQSLISAFLPDYFFDYLNTLSGKSNKTLRSLSSFISQKRQYVIEFGYKYLISPQEAQRKMSFLL